MIRQQWVNNVTSLYSQQNTAALQAHKKFCVKASEISADIFNNNLEKTFLKLRREIPNQKTLFNSSLSSSI